MSTLYSLPLNITAGDDFQAILTCFASDLAQLDVSSASSATFSVYITPEDTAPLLSVSTTPGEQGELIFGVAPPVPVGVFGISQAVLATLGTATFVQSGISAVIVDTVANVAALEALPTTSYLLSNVVYVSSPPTGSTGMYQWSPGDTRSPNGVTIVAGNASTGNWLLVGTVTVILTPAATAALAGFARAEARLEVTLADGTVSRLIGGPVYIAQAVP